MNITEVIMTLGLMISFIKNALFEDQRVTTVETLLEDIRNLPPNEWFDNCTRTVTPMIEQIDRMMQSTKSINMLIQQTLDLLYEITPSDQIPAYELSLHYIRQKYVESLRHCLRDVMFDYPWNSEERQKMNELDKIYITQLSLHARRINEIEIAEIEHRLKRLSEDIENPKVNPWDYGYGNIDEIIQNQVRRLKEHYQETELDLEKRKRDSMRITQASFRRSKGSIEQRENEEFERSLRYSRLKKIIKQP